MGRYYSINLLEEIKKRCNGFCECCGIDITLDKHHILEWTKGGPTILANLIALCPSCHRQIPLILDQSQQKYLQAWHQNNINGNKSLTHNILKKDNKFIIGSNTYINCKHVLVINDQNIITPFEEKNRFYVNIIMLEGFNPQMLVLNNKLIISNNNSEIINGNNYLSVNCNNQKVFELTKMNNEIYLSMMFLYKNKPFKLNLEKTIFPGNNTISNCIFEGGTAISYND